MTTRTRFDPVFRGVRAHASRAIAVVVALIASICVTSGGGMGSTNPMELLEQPSPAGTMTRVTYGPDPLQYAELRLPEGPGPYPVAVIVHGGCWQSVIDGLPRSAVSLDLIRPLAVAMTEAGYATYNVEYRRVGDPGGAWPGTFRDVAAATDHLRAIAAQDHLDLARTIVVGHSAGGHLVTWLAVRPKLSASSELYTKDPLPIHGVLNIDGPADLHFSPAALAGFCPGAVESLIGGTVAQFPDRYRDASAGSFVPVGVRQEVFVSHAFGSGWEPYVSSVAAAAAKAGDTVNVHRRLDSNHFDLINPKADAWHEIITAANALRDAPLK